MLVSFLFGALLVGGNTIQKLGLPVSTVQMIQGSILFFVAAGTMFMNYRVVWKKKVGFVMVQVILLATLTAAVAQGTPLLITALGEIMTQRSGVLNLGLEGMMLIGAAASFIALVNTNSLILAVLIGALCSGLLALVHAFLSITCGSTR